MSQVITLTPGTPQTLASANGTACTDNTAQAAGTDLDNTAELAVFVDLELQCVFASGLSGAMEQIDVFFVPKLDGSNAGVVGSNVFQPSHYRGTFIVPHTSTTSGRLTIEGISVGPWKYTLYILNFTGQNINSGWTLKAFPSKYLAT